MTYLLDTDILIDFFKFKEPANSVIQQLTKRGTFALSALTITELRSGWTPGQADRLLPQLYALCMVEVVTKEIAQQAGTWRQEYRQQGRQFSTPDTVIAATAYLKDFSLVTKNTKDYPMPQLQLYPWEANKEQ